MLKTKRSDYQREYRFNFGDLMKEQIKEWFNKHPDYLIDWRQSHPFYFQRYRRKNLERLRDYWRDYKRKKRMSIKKNTPIDKATCISKVEKIFLE